MNKQIYVQILDYSINSGALLLVLGFSHFYYMEIDSQFRLGIRPFAYITFLAFWLALGYIYKVINWLIDPK